MLTSSGGEARRTISSAMCPELGLARGYAVSPDALRAPGRRVLMVAFHFPPCTGTSGVFRTAKFVRYLPEYGWSPVVLTASPRAYPSSDDGTGQSTPDVPVARALALDAARHLALGGRYPRLAALPDRWTTWWLSGVLKGLRLIRRFQPLVLWSTYPIATAHLIGLTLHRLSRLPWVAEFRDPMTEEDYPRDAALRGTLRWVERRTVSRASRVVFTAPSACTFYRQRYPAISAERFTVIPNGYDDADLDGLPLDEPGGVPKDRPLQVLHAGVIYRDERDPSSFFRALADLKRQGVISARALRIVLRAPSDEQHLEAFLRSLGLDDVVSVLPTIPHRRALEECAAADALLLIQGASCNRQIPAKVYEYLKLGRPILALTDPRGDTAQLLNQTGGATILPSDDRAITVSLPRFLAAVRAHTHPGPASDTVDRFSRRLQAKALAGCLVAVTGVDGQRSA